MDWDTAWGVWPQMGPEKSVGNGRNGRLGRFQSHAILQMCRMTREAAPGVLYEQLCTLHAGIMLL